MKCRSYIDAYRERIEELLQKGASVGSIVRILRVETQSEIPYNSILAYLKRHQIPYHMRDYLPESVCKQ